MANNISGTVQERIRKRMEDLADDIATGGCLSAGDASAIGAAYANKVGVIEGLALAERELLDVIEEAEKREG